MKQASLDTTTWWVRNAGALKSSFRIVLGVVWLIDGVLKFTSGFNQNFNSAVVSAGGNAPSWLSGWFSFWASYTSNQANANLIVYSVGVLELLLGLALILGLMRKTAYLGGVVLSLLIWAIPEGFGGPYQTNTGGTDVGTGVIYAIAFLGLIVINATYGPSRFSLDHLIERRFPGWARVAEFGKAPMTPLRRPTAGSQGTG
jgi:nitrite reductase (NO-forming)